MSLHLRVTRGLESWLPPRRQLDAISRVLSSRATVRLVPRSQVAVEWNRTRRTTPFPGQYAFRAYSNRAGAVVFVDDTETPDSVLWLILHELAHMDLYRAPFVHRAYRLAPRPDGYLTSDAAHQAAPGERLADFVADQWAMQVGARPGLNRDWWRRRVRRMKA